MIKLEEVRITTTSLRIPTELNERIKRKATEIGASQNSMMMVLLDLGLKLYEGQFTVQVQNQQK